jgi:ribulose-5-phosphate 4-epimerase/fuculose-1-phosphate aldolase
VAVASGGAASTVRTAAPRRRADRTPEQERLHRKERLAAAMRLFAGFGYDEGAGGHVTARDPVQPDHFWVNPFGRPFGAISVSDLLLVDADGQVVAGEGRVNPAVYAIHSQIHTARPDVIAAAHTHSMHGRAWSALRRLLDPLTQDACAFFEDHALFGDYTGVVLAEDEGRRIAQALAGHKAVILANHGLLTVGGSVEEAAWWFIAMDRCCQAQLLAEAAGPPHLISVAGARAAREQIGSPWAGRFNFRPLYESIVHSQPDLLR